MRRVKPQSRRRIVVKIGTCSEFFFNGHPGGHLCEKDISLKRTLGVGTCCSNSSVFFFFN